MRHDKNTAMAERALETQSERLRLLSAEVQRVRAAHVAETLVRKAAEDLYKEARRRERGLTVELAEARDNVTRKEDRYRMSVRHVTDLCRRNRKLIAELDEARAAASQEQSIREAMLAEARDIVARKERRFQTLLGHLDAERERNKALTAQIDAAHEAMAPAKPAPGPCTYKGKPECRRCLFDPKACGGCGPTWEGLT